MFWKTGESKMLNWGPRWGDALGWFDEEAVSPPQFFEIFNFEVAFFGGHWGTRWSLEAIKQQSLH